MKTSFSFVFFVFLSVLTSAQTTGPEQDCIHAIPVCATMYIQNASYQGSGQTQEINPNYSCLENGENNSVWYIFNITATGSLEFSIIPQGSDDYDFALYNLTGHSCADIFNGGLEVRCDYSFSNGPIGASLNVNLGETYVLLIDNFSSSTFGYTIDFNPGNRSTASIIDFLPPGINSITPPDCDHPSSLTVVFSEPVKCNSLDVNGHNFNITGPSVVSVAEVNCADDASASIELILSAPITVAGNYQLAFNPAYNNHTVEDLCGNTSTAQNIPFSSPAGVVADFTYSCNGKEFSFTNTSMGDSTSFNWTFGGTHATTNPNPTHLFDTAGAYIVQLISQNSNCTDTVSRTIIVFDSLVSNFIYSPDTPRAGQTVALANTSPGATEFNWVIDNGSPIFLPSTSHVFYTPGAHSVCLLVSAGCYADTTCQTITVLDSATRIASAPEPVAIEILPNPVNGITQINLSNLAEPTGEATLYNALGEKITKYRFSSRSFEMDFGSIPPGVYLLRIESGKAFGVKEVLKL